MFETAEVGHRVSKAEFKEREEKLRTKLLAAQEKLAVSPFSVVVVISGAEGSGKGRLVNTFIDWMDARGIETHAIWKPTDEELDRPHMWAFWRVLPPRGKLGIFFGSWYTRPIIDRVFKRIGQGRFDQHLDQIIEFEQMLSDENVLVVKFWLHLSKKQQRKRLERLAKDEDESWRVSRLDWKFFKKYRLFHEISEHALRRTSLRNAHWHVIEAADKNYRTLKAAELLLEAMEEKLATAEAVAATEKKPDLPVPAVHNIIRNLDLSLSLKDRDYRKQLKENRSRLGILTRKMIKKGRSMVIVFEGPDAGGKGGAIRRLLSGMDSRTYRVVGVSAPSDEELARPYLWRFWRQIPGQGQVTIFDRSWYGRVLVERVEGYCSKEDWQRAYGEINQFENELNNHGIIIVKFYLAISPEEQLERFRTRQKTPYKQYKITEEDWRNRQKWDAYEAAACEMIERTSVEHWPWTLVEANDKPYARIKVMQTVINRLEKEL